MTATAWDRGYELLTVGATNPRLAAYRDRPAAFASDLVAWPDGQGLTAYQAEILEELPAAGREAVRGPHGIGKSALGALAALWFATTRDGDDWKIPTTASAWRQLTAYLWPEIHKWARLLRWDLIGRSPFDVRRELLTLQLTLVTGSAFALASDDPSTIEGAHADHLLYVFDEAKMIPAATFDAAEGAFAGAGSDTANEAYALAISTPGAPQGRFYDIHVRKPGTEDWRVRHVTLDEAIAAGRVSRQWAEQRRRQWGEASSVYQNRVLGEFAAADEDSVIPLAWVEAANQRWLAMCATDEDGRPLHATWTPTADLLAVGVDVARSGTDRTVFALRWGPDAIGPLRDHAGEPTTVTAGRVAGILREHGGRAVVDVIGIGAGVVDTLRDDFGEARVLAFNASEGTQQRDRSGELGFVNCRSAAWWHLRELLDPSNNSEVALPPDDALTGDLTAPRWDVVGKGLIRVESKDTIRPRLGRSTDSGDAVVQSFWLDVEVTGSTSQTAAGAGSFPSAIDTSW